VVTVGSFWHFLSIMGSISTVARIRIDDNSYASLMIPQIFIKNQRGDVLLLSFYGRIENKNVCSILLKKVKTFKE